jgi:glycerol-3-phosphate dehydrogenase (NAD(P)+)
MTRGLAEIVRLAVAEGAEPLTLAGLAGLGDLIATCSSTLSRNYTLGRELITTGKPLETLLNGRHSVVEGVLAARCALRLAERHAIEMPITQILVRLFDGENPRKLLGELMQRDLRSEQDRLY